MTGSPAEAAAADKRPTWLQRYGPRLIALASAIGITTLVLVFRHQLVALGGYGYLGVFLISMLGHATVILPVPSMAIVFAGGAVLNPLLVGLVAGVAEPIGELTAYLAGYAGNAVIEDSQRVQRIQSWIERHWFVTLFVLSAIPNPLFDTAGITAGMLRFPVLRFLLACWLGRTVRAIAIAHLGYLFPRFMDWIRQWLQ